MTVKTPTPLSPRQIEDVAVLLRLAEDPARLKILATLDAAGEMNVSELATALGTAQPPLSVRLMTLRVSGIVIGRRAGTTKRYSLTQKGRILMVAAMALIEADKEHHAP